MTEEEMDAVLDEIKEYIDDALGDTERITRDQYRDALDDLAFHVNALRDAVRL